jgi:nitrile hydratase subunit beta
MLLNRLKRREDKTRELDRQNEERERMVAISQIVPAEGERSRFAAGERVRVLSRFPIGHYRVPHYIRGKNATVERVIEPAAVNNEEEGFGRNAGSRRYYYRVAFPMTELWPGYKGAPGDSLRIEVFETWLERA